MTDKLGMRMKEFYETVPKARLMRRTPVAIRIDGKVFHTFTRGFNKPFDHILGTAMQETMRYLCQNIQGCVLGYTQSDEITLILVDYKRLNSSAWFDYEVQKMCSVAASMATMAFNKAFHKAVEDADFFWKTSLTPQSVEIQQGHQKYMEILRAASSKGAMFDARCFNIPREEVTNLIYWRQLDATRNSIQMVGQANFSHKELQGKSCIQIKKMLSDIGIEWDYYPISYQRGSCCIKTYIQDVTPDGIEHIRSEWIIDKNIPLFIGEGREYIESLIQSEEE